MSVIKRRNKNSKHYIDNKKFYEALKEYKQACNAVEDVWNKQYSNDKEKLIESGLSEKQALAELPEIPYPRVPEYLGMCMFLIAQRLCDSPNFYNYTYKDEMVADGYEDCILRIRSFDPEKSTNPFSYFTQTCYFAAVRRIKKEKKQKDIKTAMVLNSGILNEMESVTQSGDAGTYENSYLSFLQEAVGEDQKLNDEFKGSKILKKTTKAHQKRLKELEELEKSYESLIVEETDNIDDDIEE